MSMTSAEAEPELCVSAAPPTNGRAQPTRAELPSSRNPNPAADYIAQKTNLPGSLNEASAAAFNLSVPDFLNRLLESRLLTTEELSAFLSSHDSFADSAASELITTLVDQGVLTEYQVSRLLSGQSFGLVLGNYRIVERIGAGGMGVVYKAEHIHMKRAVAIKVLITEEDRNSIFLQRFYSEMQATAVLSHPNIVLAFDAGEMPVPASRHETLRYLVMEFVPGKNLEQVVLDHGPLPIAQACDYVRQAASGLQHAYEHGLVHRDIKPSNLLLTPQNQVKILDFGLARLCRRRHTEPHTMLGSVDYMAPEQARDARSVDIRADIYGLGGTLYWLLTGRKPFPDDRPAIEALLARQRESPLSLHRVRPDAPLELEAVVCQMMAQDSSDRYPNPLAVITVLGAFQDRANSEARVGRQASPNDRRGELAWPPAESLPCEIAEPRRVRRILLVCNRPEFRSACRAAFEADGMKYCEADHAAEADKLLREAAVDLVLVDAQLSDGSGPNLCLRLRTEPPAPHLRIILLTPENTPDWLAAGQQCDADDCLPRTVHAPEIVSRIRTALRIKEAEECADRLAVHLLSVNQRLGQALRLREADQSQAQDVLIFALARMVELRGMETGGHLLRMQSYVRCLAEEAMRLPAFAGQIDDAYVRLLERSVLLHDIGKIAIPDHILLKPGKLDAEERSLMEAHTVVGSGIVTDVAHQHGAPPAHLQMAADIARHHHERYDGTGYPAGLSGAAIPLAARIVTIADIYDALRSKLVYKPGLAHAAAKRLILEVNSGHFDPGLLVALRNGEANMEQIFDQTKD